jgi:hypothetical protein
MVLSIVPYSCRLCKMCRACADWGVVILNVSDVFLIAYLQAEPVWPTYDMLQELQVSW